MKNIAKLLGIIVLIALCGFTACDEDTIKSLLPGQLTVQNEPSGGTVTIYKVPSLGGGIINIPDLSNLEIVAASTGTSTYTLLATDIGKADSTGIFIDSGNFWVSHIIGTDTSTLVFEKITLNNGSGTVNHNTMKPFAQFLLGI